MATKRERGASPRRRRPVKKSAVKKASNSKISEAQKATADKRKEDTLRGQGEADRLKRLAALSSNPNNPKLQPKTGTPMASSQQGLNQDAVAARDNVAGKSMAAAAQKIVGLSAPVMASMQASAAEKRKNDPQAYVNLYGGPVKDRAARISANLTAITEAQNAQAKSKGQAVWMGTKSGRVKTRVVGDMPDEPGADTYLKTSREEILTKNVLMSWLSDPAKVDQIMAVAQKAGLDVTSYEDTQKLWASVVNQAGDSFSLAGQKVTPWALIQLRGKYAVGGRPANKVTTSTSIDEMDPATARLMFERTAQDQLGRAPTKAEVDDFIAKAQTISKDNPTVTKTTSKVGFDGEITDSTRVTTGGGGEAKAQLAAMDQAKQSEDYASYQAAGNYFPMLFEALQSPV